MNDTDINDKRNPSEFKGVSFSKFQKTKVKQELINCLASAKIESACYWTAELICSGAFYRFMGNNNNLCFKIYSFRKSKTANVYCHANGKFQNNSLQWIY